MRGWLGPDHERRRRPEENLLDIVEDEIIGFYFIDLYSKREI